MSARKKIAVVGGGISGIMTAYVLAPHHDVVLIEAAPRLGGHANAVEIDDPAGPIELDTAFLIFNDGSYLHFHEFLEQLGLSSRIATSDMSFGFSNDASGLAYQVNAGLGGAFLQRRNLMRPEFWQMLLELRRFRRLDFRDLDAEGDLPLREYAARRGFSKTFCDDFLYPMGASVWSVPTADVEAIPARLFVRFFANHRALKRERGARWRTIRGASRQYIRAFERSFTGRCETSQRVTAVRRRKDDVILVRDRREETFDHVVLALHADQSLGLLGAPTGDERRLLGAWRYSAVEACLHAHESILPGLTGRWASWNIRYRPARAGAPARSTVTYYLNRIQQPRAERDYFVTLDPEDGAIPRALWRGSYRHPIFDQASLATQAELARLNDDGRVLFCGSYFGAGFHEDAIRSAIAVAARLGVRSPFAATADAPPARADDEAASGFASSVPRIEVAR